MNWIAIKDQLPKFNRVVLGWFAKDWIECVYLEHDDYAEHDEYAYNYWVFALDGDYPSKAPQYWAECEQPNGE